MSKWTLGESKEKYLDCLFRYYNLLIAARAYTTPQTPEFDRNKHALRKVQDKIDEILVDKKGGNSCDKRSKKENSPNGKEYTE